MKKLKPRQRRAGLKNERGQQSSATLSPAHNNLAIAQQAPTLLQHLPQSELLQLQRQVGNQALGQLFQNNEAPDELPQNTGQPLTSLTGPRVVQLWPITPVQMASSLSLNSLPRRVQRDESEEGTLTPAGNNYELKVERKGDRWSFSLAFAMSRA